MKVNISPGVSIIKIFKALDYESWYAFAEYIDNSISSYLKVKDLIILKNPKYTLKINIDLNFVDKTIMIRDNAGGIDKSKYEYAFRAAEIPDDTSGLNEFGMGMKTASSWLANKWTVKTKAFEEEVERTIHFNVNEVVTNNVEELVAKEVKMERNAHYTIIKLEELTDNAPLQRDLNKIRKHLASIHRKFISRGDIQIFVNDEELEYKTSAILSAPKWDDESGNDIKWKIEINKTFGSNKRVTGFIALLETMSTSVHNGFSLFRRGRVIEGSGDDLFRPKALNGQVGSHQYKRVFGELELEGFNVDFTKGKFQGDKDFDELLNLLQDYCDNDEFPLLSQSRKYRKPLPKESLKDIARKGVKDYQKSVANSEIQQTIQKIIDTQGKLSPSQEKIREIPERNKLESIVERIVIGDETWIIELNLVDNIDFIDWIEVLEDSNVKIGVRKIKIRLSMIHPFMSSFGTDDIQPFIRLAMALAIAESISRLSGGSPSSVRRNLNKLLNNSDLSK